MAAMGINFFHGAMGLCPSHHPWVYVHPIVHGLSFSMGFHPWLWVPSFQGFGLDFG
jgi:hypothetical protein